jgi:hypothetical protein
MLFVCRGRPTTGINFCAAVADSSFETTSREPAMTTAQTTQQGRPYLAFDERTDALVGFGLPFNEVLGHPREFLVADLPHQLAATMKGGRIAVRVRR